MRAVAEMYESDAAPGNRREQRCFKLVYLPLPCMFGSQCSCTESITQISCSPPWFLVDRKTNVGLQCCKLRMSPLRSPISALPKGSQSDGLLQPPSKSLPLPISAARSCSESGLGGGGRSSTQIASSSLPGLYLVFLGNV